MLRRFKEYSSRVRLKLIAALNFFFNLMNTLSTQMARDIEGWTNEKEGGCLKGLTDGLSVLSNIHLSFHLVRHGPGGWLNG